MSKKVAIIQAGFMYCELFLNNGWEIVSEVAAADLVLFTGGEDVSSHLYNETKHPKTFSSAVRDSVEKTLFENISLMGKPMVGICRGGQFLNVMSGGRMYQHVTLHTQDHKMTVLETGEYIDVSSTHHQMMRPSEKGVILAVAKQGGSKEFMNNGYVASLFRDELDTEVVFYPETKCLCFQPHPEFYGPKFDGMRKYFFDMIDKHLLKKGE